VFLPGVTPIVMGSSGPGIPSGPKEITIAHLLKDAGYATAHFGKWHVGPVKIVIAYQPLERWVLSTGYPMIIFSKWIRSSL
jgi:arylsulfatase A-like enzyme